MGGRPWHWVAASTAAAAVVGAVLVNDTSSVSSFVAQPYATVDYAPEVGSPVIATPTVDATTVNPPPPPPAVKPTNTPPRQPPAHPNPRQDSSKPTKWTVTIPIPDLPFLFPDCETAEFFDATPLRRGQPGYRDELDEDHDGLACE